MHSTSGMRETPYPTDPCSLRITTRIRPRTRTGARTGKRTSHPAETMLFDLSSIITMSKFVGAIEGSWSISLDREVRMSEAAHCSSEKVFKNPQSLPALFNNSGR